MKIEWVLDDEDGIDPEYAVGDIAITDAENRIEERVTYIDSWLEILIAALKSAQAGQTATIDIWEEPEPLIVVPGDSGLTLSYRGTRVFVESLDEFRRELLAATSKFLDLMNGTGKLTPGQLNDLRSRLQLDIQS